MAFIGLLLLLSLLFLLLMFLLFVGKFVCICEFVFLISIDVNERNWSCDKMKHSLSSRFLGWIETASLFHHMHRKSFSKRWVFLLLNNIKALRMRNKSGCITPSMDATVSDWKSFENDENCIAHSVCRTHYHLNVVNGLIWCEHVNKYLVNSSISHKLFALQVVLL